MPQGIKAEAFQADPGTAFGFGAIMFHKAKQRLRAPASQLELSTGVAFENIEALISGDPVEVALFGCPRPRPLGACAGKSAAHTTASNPSIGYSGRIEITVTAYWGKANAKKASLAATSTNCRPSSKYVMGGLVTNRSTPTCHRGFPEPGSNARKLP
jgi:hypothetical protein